MSYQRFRLPTETVASVATVAKVERENPISPATQTVATVASVARVEPETALLPTSDVLLIHERVTARLMGLGKTRAEAEIVALPIVRAELHNDCRLAPDQHNHHHCLVCDGIGTPGNILLPFLSSLPGDHHWMHSGCWSDHRSRQSEKAEACLRVAGLLKSRLN